MTNNGPEQKIIDTRVPGPNSAEAWTSQAASFLMPPGRIDGLLSNNYRQNTCAGYSAFLYMTTAGWGTDAGQRIGAAYEVEGGADPVMPSAPQGTTVY